MPPPESSVGIEAFTDILTSDVSDDPFTDSPSVVILPYGVSRRTLSRVVGKRNRRGTLPLAVGELAVMFGQLVSGILWLERIDDVFRCPLALDFFLSAGEKCGSRGEPSKQQPDSNTGSSSFLPACDPFSPYSILSRDEYALTTGKSKKPLDSFFPLEVIVLMIGNMDRYFFFLFLIPFSFCRKGFIWRIYIWR